MRGILIAVIAGGLLAGCVGGGGGESPTVSPRASASPELSASTEPSPTGEPGPTGEPSPTGEPGPTVPAATASTGEASPGATIIIVPDATPGSVPKATPAPTPRPSLAPLKLVGLRYRLVDRLGRPLFCDPDYYPVARANEAELAQERYSAIRADTPTYVAITAHLGIDRSSAPTVDQVLAIYREWKMLNALALTPVDGAYRFDYIAASAPDAETGFHVTGTIDASGSIAPELRDPSGRPPCPICLARGTAIATPNGPVAVEDLRPGMAVWTVGATGVRVVARVSVVGSTRVPPTHRVVHLVLADDRVLEASPGHQLPDGRRLGDLRAGDLVDGARVVSAELVPYAGGATFDLLPSGSTGTYWAGGVPLASTIHLSR